MAAIRIFLFVVLISALVAIVGKYALLFIDYLRRKEKGFFDKMVVKANVELPDVEEENPKTKKPKAP